MSAPLSSQFALDVNAAGAIRVRKGNDQQQALRQAAEQFESIFLQKMIHAMREASPKSELWGSEQSRFYESMMDQQWAQHLAGRGLGLADQLVAQLNRGASDHNLTTPVQPAQPLNTQLLASAPYTQFASTDRGHLIDMALDRHLDRAGGFSLRDSDRDRIAQQTQRILNEYQQSPDSAHDFVGEVLHHAKLAEHETGIPAELMVAQAILETGWGKHQIRHPDGSNSHNLFAIKAGPMWEGRSVETPTHEYIGERRVETNARFRAYDSYADSFRDYARLLTTHPRYSDVVSAESPREAARALESAGYATDPGYAEKLIALMEHNLKRGK